MDVIGWITTSINITADEEEYQYIKIIGVIVFKMITYKFLNNNY